VKFIELEYYETVEKMHSRNFSTFKTL